MPIHCSSNKCLIISAGCSCNGKAASQIVILIATHQSFAHSAPSPSANFVHFFLRYAALRFIHRLIIASTAWCLSSSHILAQTHILFQQAGGSFHYICSTMSFIHFSKLQYLRWYNLASLACHKIALRAFIGTIAQLMQACHINTLHCVNIATFSCLTVHANLWRSLTSIRSCVTHCL